MRAGAGQTLAVPPTAAAEIAHRRKPGWQPHGDILEGFSDGVAQEHDVAQKGAAVADPVFGQSPADVPGGAQAFTAMGNEPGWRLDIEGGRMTLKADYGATKIAIPAPAAPEPIPGGRAYAGEASGRPVRVTVLDRICHDTMTGMPQPATVGIEFDGGKLDGCGGEPAALLNPQD